MARASREVHRRRPCSWVAGLADRNDLPLLHASDLADEILADAAGVAVQTRGRAPGHVHPGQRPGRGAPPVPWGPLRLARRADRGGRAHRGPGPGPVCSSRHPSCTTRPSVCAGPTGPAGSGPRATRSTPPRPCWRPRPGCSRPGAGGRARRLHGHCGDGDRDQPARPGPSTQPRSGAGRGADRHLGPVPRRVGRPGRDGQVHHHGRAPSGVGSRARSGLGAGPGPLAAAAEVLAEELGIDTENTAKWLYEHRREAERMHDWPSCEANRRPLTSRPATPATRAEVAGAEASWPAGTSARASWSSSTRPAWPALSPLTNS